MRHSWPDEIIDVVDMPPDPDFGPVAFVTVRSNYCAECGKTRRQARGVPCVPPPDPMDEAKREFARWRDTDVEVV